MLSLPVKSLLVQTARAIQSESNVKVRVPQETTIAQASKAAADALQQDISPLILLERGINSGVSARLRARALENPEGTKPTPMKFRAHAEEPLPPPTIKTRHPRVREALQNMADRVRKIIEREPYPILLETRAIETSLIALPSARFVFSGIDASVEDPVCHVIDALAIWDTGCHVTTVSSDLLSSDFLHFIESPANETYKIATQGGRYYIIQADGILRFSNTDLQIPFVVKVVSRKLMPNQLSGILLGQIGLIDAIACRTIPRMILAAEGKDVIDDSWGELILEKHFDPDTCEVKTL